MRSHSTPEWEWSRHLGALVSEVRIPFAAVRAGAVEARAGVEARAEHDAVPVVREGAVVTRCWLCRSGLA
eukprot:4738249-Heterocapsa_arctica.AAC.1